MPVVEKSEVVVAFVVVEFEPMISEKFRVPIEPVPRLKFVENRFVELAVVEKSEVVVAFVVVEFEPMISEKFRVPIEPVP